MEQAGSADVIYDQSGCITDAGPRAREILGRAREQLIGSNIQEIGLEVLRPEMRVFWTRAVKREQFVFEARRVLDDGSAVPVEVTLRMSGPAGDRRYAATISDLTERGGRDEAFEQLMDTLTDAAYVIDFNGKFLDVNHRAVETLGYSREEFLAMGPADIDPLMPRGEISDLIVGMGLGEKQLFPTQHRTKDGTIIPVEISSSLVPHQGKAAILSIARDITDRMRSEMMTQARLRLLELAPSTTVMGFLEATLDELETLTDSRVGFCNFVEGDGETLTPQAWSTRTRREFCKTEEGLKLRVSEAGVWADAIRERRPIIHNDFAAVPNRKGMPAGHAEVVRELVVPVFRNDMVVAVFAVGNKPRAYVERDVEIVSSLADLAWDIAGRKQAEADLRKSEEQLRQSQKMESVGRLAGGIAHDFNNMLGVILGHAELAMAQLDPQQPVYAYLREIRDAAERSAGIARQLLAFARRQPATPTLLDINRTVGKMVGMLRRLIGEDIE
ncbi:MAG: PAS domain S-box protein, partial [Thermoleophilia bacterium]|nr:PAS domain S-box protein [Thermoleophilia bacterium]